MRRLAAVAVATFWLWCSPALASIPCDNWPTERVPLIPEPFADWVVVQCDLDGQNLTARGRLWVEHGGIADYAIAANRLPGGASALNEDRFGPAFTVLGTRKMAADETAALRQQFAETFPKADAGPTPPAIHLLTLASSARRTVHVLIAFVWSGQPRHLIHCLDDCRSWTALDVLTPEELMGRKQQNGPE